MNYLAIDTASLAWLLPELGKTLGSARAQLALAQNQADPKRHKHLVGAKRAVHEAIGALQVLNAKGVVHYLQTLEGVLDTCIGEQHLDAHVHTVLDQSCADANAYLHELKQSGKGLQPLAIYSSYEALCLLNHEQALRSDYHPVDLFFPHLGWEVPRELHIQGTMANSVDHLIETRQSFENLSLKVFDQSITEAEITLLCQMIGMIAHQSEKAQHHSFWKVCQAVLQSLVVLCEQDNQGLKRWLGRINLQIQRLISGKGELSERVMREGLFYLSQLHNQHQQLSSLQELVVHTYNLEHCVPDYRQARYGRALPAQLKIILEPLARLKTVWNESLPAAVKADGIAMPQHEWLRRLNEAKQAAQQVQFVLSEHGQNDLSLLAKTLVEDVSTVIQNDQPLPMGLGIEGAKALLWLEECLKTTGVALQDRQVQTTQMVAQLQHSQHQNTQQTTLASTPLHVEVMTQLARDLALRTQVIQEAKLTLSAVEQHLDEFFRYRKIPAQSVKALAPLEQISSALSTIDLPQLSLALHALHQRCTELFKQPDTVNQTAFTRIATLLSQITTALDNFVLVPAQVKRELMFDAAAFELIAPGAQVTNGLSQPPTAGNMPFESIESLSVQRRANVDALNQQISQNPLDERSSRALAQTMQALRDDAELTGDLDLHALIANPSTAGANAVGSIKQTSFESAALIGASSLPAHPSARASTAAALNIAPSLELSALGASQSTQSHMSAPPAQELAFEQEITGVFIEEARELLSDIEHVLQALETKPHNQTLLQDIRRGFHTLKGSARMVGFQAFGDAAWHVEQTINTALAKAAPASMDLIQLMRCGRDDLSVWLSELDDALFERTHASSFGLHGLNAAPVHSGDTNLLLQAATGTLTVNSHLAGFISRLAPYQQAITRGLDRQSFSQQGDSRMERFARNSVAADTRTADTNGLGVFDMPLAPPNSTKEPLTLAAFEASGDHRLTPVSMSTVGYEAAPQNAAAGRPNIRLVANNEGMRPQDFIEKARAAVAQAQNQFELNTQDHVPLLDRAQLAQQSQSPTAASQDNMMSVGPLRLPKQLYNIYLQEAIGHMRVLQQSLGDALLEAPCELTYDSYRCAHSLKGGAATIGFGALKEMASPLEHILQWCLEAKHCISVEDLTLLEGAARTLAQMLGQFACGIYPETMPRMVAALQAMYQRFAQSTPPHAAPIAPPAAIASSLAPPAAKPSAQAAVAAYETIGLALPGHAQPQERTPTQESPQKQATSLPVINPDFPSINPFNLNDDALLPDLESQSALDARDDGVTDDIDADIWFDFEHEAQELLPNAESALLALPKQLNVLGGLRRDLHTLKGSSRMAGAMRLGALVHELESKLETSLNLNEPFVSAASHRALMVDFDLILELYDSLKHQAAQPMVSQANFAANVHANNPFANEFSQLMAQTSALFDDALSHASLKTDALQLTPLDEATRSHANNHATPKGIDLPDLEFYPSSVDSPSFNAPPTPPTTYANDVPLIIEPFQPFQPFEPTEHIQAARHAQPQPQQTNVSNADVLASLTPHSTPSAPAAARPALTKLASPATPAVATQNLANVQPNVAAALLPALPALRMRADLLDHWVNQATQVSGSKGRIDQHILQLRQSLRDLTENVERTREQLREIEIQAESQLSARHESSQANHSNFDPLEFDRFTRFQELSRMLTESLSDLLTVRDSVASTLRDAEHDLLQQSKATKDLTQSLIRSRLVAFDLVSDRLYRVARQTARETGKQVILDVQGGHLPLDRSILERIIASLEHLVRNSVVHGIEMPEQRKAAGKSSLGTVRLILAQRANELEIVFADDGAGLPLTKIHDHAVAKGVLDAQAMPTTQQLAELIFTPGFSTASEVTELAGRGVGMDVVRSDIAALGGRVSVSTTPLQSTRFTIRIPLALSMNHVLMVLAKDMQYAIPSSLIQSIVTVKPADLAQAYDQGSITQRDVKYPFAHLSDLMNIPTQTALLHRSATLVLMSNDTERLALHVDAIVGKQESVVKSLNPLMSRVPGLSSATLLNNGGLCLIVDPIQLHVANQQGRLSRLEAASHSDTTQLSKSSPAFEMPSALANAEPASVYALSSQVRRPNKLAPMAEVVQAEPHGRTDYGNPRKNRQQRVVMVVDDSLTVRRVTQKLLLREGWEVLLAKDGMDALEQLQAVTPDLMLVDIEMPRMDGFDLTRNIRSDNTLKGVPIIMITSRIADKHREHAASLGVNAYMGKPYRDDELLAEMSRLTSTPR